MMNGMMFSIPNLDETKEEIKDEGDFEKRRSQFVV